MNVPVRGRFLVAVVLCGTCLPARAAQTTPAEPADLAAREAELLRHYQELERSFLRLADLLDASDPRRAALLRSASDRARGEQLGERLETIVAELRAGRLLKAGAAQEESLTQLRGLLEILSAADDDRRREDGRQKVREFVTRLTRAIMRQREIQGATEAGVQEADVVRRQADLADEARTLAADLGRFARPDQADAPERKPSPGEDDAAAEEGRAEGRGDPAGPSQPETDDGDEESSRARRTRQRLEAAERRMRAAEAQLQRSRRREAQAEQDKAIEELETARAELEEILRQLREDEVDRMLVQLAARVRQMLKDERAVRTGAGDLAAVAADPGSDPEDRERKLEAARLGRLQASVGQAAQRALIIVRDDGSAVAVPQALHQVRDDAEQASRRLERGDVDGTTLGLLDDLVAGLEELLAALEQAQNAARSGREGRDREGGRGPPGERPLVDAIAELKMLRSLQLRVNARTSRFSQLLGADAAVSDHPELRAALGRLAERQRLIERAARDIASGRTE